MKLNKFLFLLLLAQLSFAQPVTTAKIEGIKQNGLHKITIGPELRALSQKQLEDLRIFDSKQNEVPYYSVINNTAKTAMVFEPFEILSKTIIPRKTTSIVFANPGMVINEVTLSVANADISKSYSISGSNDQKEWFGLIDRAQLANIENTTSTSEYKQLTLPLSSYRFLKIDLDDKKTLPINILGIGKLTTKTNTAAFANLTPTKINTTQIKAEKKTLIHLTFNNNQVIDKISFGITAPSFYKRQVRIYKNIQRKTRKRTETYEQELAVFELSSDKTNSFENLDLFEKDIFIAIENRDNQPLAIDKIQLSQIPIFVIADLKANESYTIKTGDKKLGIPDYDISYFKTKTYGNLPEANISTISRQQNNDVPTTTPSFWQQSWFLWACIGIAGIAILYFAVSLIKDMN